MRVIEGGEGRVGTRAAQEEILVAEIAWKTY